MIRSAPLGNPVARKDLLTLMRSSRVGLLLIAYLGVMTTPTLIFLLRQSRSADHGPSGADLFQILATVQIFSILLLAPASVALLMQREHARQTWDLLVMSRLTGFQIVFGKFLTGMGFHLLLVLSAVPLYAVAVIYGSNGAVDIVRTFVVLCCTLALCAAVGLRSSTDGFSYRSILKGSAALASLTAVLTFLILVIGDTWHASIGALTFTPQFSRLAPLDPLAGLASALPPSTAITPVAELGNISHPFGLVFGTPLWAVYCSLCLIGSICLLAVASADIERTYILGSRNDAA